MKYLISLSTGGKLVTVCTHGFSTKDRAIACARLLAFDGKGEYVVEEVSDEAHRIACELTETLAGYTVELATSKGDRN